MVKKALKSLGVIITALLILRFMGIDQPAPNFLEDKIVDFTSTSLEMRDGGTLIQNVANPSAIYCTNLGYAYSMQESGGSIGVCVLPDGQICEGWAFYQGQCGQAFNYCALHGFETRLKTDGQDPYSRIYSVCVDQKDNEIGTVSKLSGLGKDPSPATCQETNTLPYNWQSPALSSGKAEIPQNSLLDLPVAFDWRDYLDENWLTPIKNQGACGSCWAFAAVGASEAAHNIGLDNPDLDLDLSEQYLVSDCLTYGNCCGGSKTMALQFIRDNGIPDESCMPYSDMTCGCVDDVCSPDCVYHTDGDCSNNSCSDRCADYENRLVTIDAFGYISPDITSIKQKLIDVGPVVVSIGMLETYGGYWDGDIYRCLYDTGTNHAVVIVGYDDDGEYWIIRNSWGESWDEDGYFKLGFGECKVESSPYYVAFNLPQYPTRTPTSTATITPTQTATRTPRMEITNTATHTATSTSTITSTLTSTATRTATSLVLSPQIIFLPMIIK